MVASWTPPKTWVLDDVFEAAVANTHLRNNLEYLFSRPKDYVNVNYSVAQSIPSSTWTTLSAFELAISTESGIIEYNANLFVDGNIWVKIDVYIPELNIWLSSGTSTQLPNGIAWRDSASISYDVGLHASLIRDIGAGDYTFQLWYIAQGATASLIENVNHTATVKEV